MDVNTISSVYERDVSNLVKEAIAQENSGDIGVYYTKKEALTLPVAGVQFPIQLQQSIASTGIVHRFAEKVNMKISETVQSQQFKRWFGDWQNDPAHASKVVNEDGTPKVVYHGTNAEFTAFNSSDGTYWFSESRDYAESMAEERSGDVLMQAFLDIKNPYYAKLPAGKFSDPNSAAKIIREAKAGGYDGLVIEADTTNELLKDTFYVAFQQNQIKSATDNIGTLDKNNPDIRYSRELTTDGRVVAVVDEDILSNLDLSNWNQETKEAAQKAATRALLKFKGGIAVDGITRKVNRISRKEFTRSEYTNELFWWNSTAFLDKMRAANNLDDIVIAATDWARDGALKHPRTDNLVDFDHGTTLIASGDTKYEAEVVVGITDKGEAVFYDIVNMKPGNFSIKKEEPSPTVTTNKSPDSIFEDSSTSTVAQQEQNVNQKHSRELETIEELKQQNELLKKQVDYWHSQTAVTVGERGMAEKFKRMALKPGKGDTQHAPQQLIGAVTEFCEIPLHFCFPKRLKSRGKA